MIYDKLSSKQKDRYRKATYIDVLTETIASMFTYEGFPEEVNTKAIEQILLHTGMVAMWKNGDDFVVSEVGYAGEPDYYGLGKKVIVTTMNGIAKEFNRDDVAIGWNNNIRSRDLNIERYANMLSEVDVSMWYNLIYSRLLPMPCVDNDTTKAQIETAISKMLKGEPSVILAKNILSQLQNGSNGIDVVNITDVNASDKLQYLSHFHDDIMRRIYTLYGQSTQSTGKMAQQSVKEIQGSTSLSFILPLDRLARREEWCKRINELYGLNTSVRFSDAWGSEWVKYNEKIDMIDGEDDNEQDEEMGTEIED